MKVIAFNCSPNKSEGSTAKILNPFLDGLREKGAEIELLYVADMNIEPCRGCTNDLLFNPTGECKIHDDMQDLYQRLSECELWIFATPNYLNNVTASMKNLMDRMEPLFEPGYEFNLPDANVEKKYKKFPNGKMLLISTCGLWGMENFNMMVEQMKYVAEMFGREFVTPLLRPHAGTMTALTRMGKPMYDVYAAAKVAGEELVETGKIASETADNVAKELVSRNSFIQELVLMTR